MGAARTTAAAGRRGAVRRLRVVREQRERSHVQDLGEALNGRQRGAAAGREQTPEVAARDAGPVGYVRQRKALRLRHFSQPAPKHPFQAFARGASFPLAAAGAYPYME